MKVVALYDFRASKDTHLSFVYKEVLTVVKQKPGSNWYRAENAKGQRGLIPANYVEVIAEPRYESPSSNQPASGAIRREYAVSRVNTQPLDCSANRSSKPSFARKFRSKSEVVVEDAKKKRAICLYDFVATSEKHLVLYTGDLVTIVREKANGWCVGRLDDGSEGKFPRNVVKMLGESKNKKQAGDDSSTSYTDEDRSYSNKTTSSSPKETRRALRRMSVSRMGGGSSNARDGDDEKAGVEPSRDVHGAKQSNGDSISVAALNNSVKVVAREQRKQRSASMSLSQSNPSVPRPKSKERSLSKKALKKTISIAHGLDKDTFGGGGERSASMRTPSREEVLTDLVPNKTRLLCVFDYTGDTDSTLLFTKGEFLTFVREVSDEWWTGKKTDGTFGVFPSSYVKVIAETQLARALYDFHAKKSTQLPLERGAIVRVVKEGRTWSTGLCNGRFGSFPTAYCDFLSSEAAAELELNDEDSMQDETEETATTTTTTTAASGATPSTAPSLSLSGTARIPRRTVQMYHVKGKDHLMLVKTVVSPKSLNDGDCFVLDDGLETVFVWNGTFARQAERDYAHLFGSMLAKELMSDLVVCEKSSETNEFWDALGGQEPPLTADEGGDDSEIAERVLKARRIYQVDAKPLVESPLVLLGNIEMLNLSRSILKSTEAYVLDIESEIFVWCGEQSAREAKAVAMDACDHLILERPPHVSVTWLPQGGESAFLKLQFCDWVRGASVKGGAVERRQPEKRASTFLLRVDQRAQPRQEQVDPQRIGCTKFNGKPRDGIAYLVANDLVRETPGDVARFLWEHHQGLLSKAVLGDYLSEPGEFEQQVLVHFLRRINLDGLPFHAALRRYLSHFRLPGESQKIDRLMEAFARQYVQKNSISYAQDSVFSLAFAAIMLNTDAHNPAIKNKMSREAFLRNTKGAALDIDDEFLSKLYDEIQANEIKLELDAFADKEMSGELRLKRGGGRFRRRWFVVANNNLYYFEKRESAAPSFILPLEALSVRATKVLGAKHCMEIYDENAATLKCCELRSDGVLVAAKRKTVVLAADSEEMQIEWIRAIRQQMMANPFYELLKRRLGEHHDIW